MQGKVKKIVVIDDLADRPHECDLLLDPNPSAARDRYQGLLPAYCTKLTGTCYTLLRPEFREAKLGLAERDGVINRVLVFLAAQILRVRPSKPYRPCKVLPSLTCSWMS